MRPAWILLTGSLVLSVPAPGALAQGTSYRDESGKLHVVGDPSEVPERYRERSRPLGEPTPARPSPPRPSAGDDGPSGRPEAAAPAAARPAPATTPTSATIPTCTLEFVGEPVKSFDGRKPRVVFTGELENTGTGRARGVQVEASVYGAADGEELDRVQQALRPPILDPGERGRFEITADFRKLNNRNPARDEVRVSVARCDPYDPESEGGSDTTPECEASIVGEISKSVDTARATLTASAEVRNDGPGTARSVQVRWTTRQMDTGDLLEVHLDPVRPLVLEPGESGVWEKTIDLDFGVRSPNRDTFEVVVERCR